MRHSRQAVWLGAVGALALMTVLSAAMGFALPNLLPKQYTHYAAAMLFLYFGTAPPPPAPPFRLAFRLPALTRSLSLSLPPPPFSLSLSLLVHLARLSIRTVGCERRRHTAEGREGCGRWRERRASGGGGGADQQKRRGRGRRRGRRERQRGEQEPEPRARGDRHRDPHAGVHPHFPRRVGRPLANSNYRAGRGEGRREPKAAAATPAYSPSTE